MTDSGQPLVQADLPISVFQAAHFPYFCCSRRDGHAAIPGIKKTSLWIIVGNSRTESRCIMARRLRIGGIESGYRGSTELYKGIRTMMSLMVLHPGMITVLLSISLAGLSGCGPAAPDYSPNLESSANLGLTSKSQSITQHPWAPGNGLSTPTANPVTPAASNYAQATAQEKPAPLPEHLSLPVWMAQALDAPEASVRIQALDIWAQQGAKAPLDPLVVALDDESAEVRAKAMEVIERNWAIDQKAEAEK